MATSSMHWVIQHLRKAALLRESAELTDGQLLEGFVSRREAAALEILVQRHAPMVWGVCRRIVENQHDAEDAFQATFLVLVRKAAAIMPRRMVANWLYGVARQTALKARATRAKRKARERQVTSMPEPEAVERQDPWCPLQPLLDEELSRLPDKYRVAIVLCDLEGKTRKEAAGQLGVPEGTLAARLARARTMLAKRLARYGIAVSGGMLPRVLAQKTASAAVPASVMSSTIKAVTSVAAGQTAAAGLVSAKVVALTEGVLRTMLLTKLKVATAVVLVLGIACYGIGSLTYTATAQQGQVVKPPAGRFAAIPGQVEEQGVLPPDDECVAAGPAAVDTEAPTVELGDLKEYFKVIGVKEEPSVIGSPWVILRLEAVQPVDPSQFNKKYKVALFDKDNTLVVVQDADFPVPIRLEKGERIRIVCWNGVRLQEHEWKRVVIRRTET